MSWDMSEKDQKAFIGQYEKHKVEVRRKIKRDVRQAVATGTKVPYDLNTLIEAGIGANTILKVIRRKRE